jgi:YHS domain-containing protein
MFIRLLIFAILGVVLYRALKSWLGNPGPNLEKSGYGPPSQMDDVMIKDPVCGIYFPQRDGVILKATEEVLYFCSNECRDSYLAQQAKSH